jgi:hypothetical protein
MTISSYAQMDAQILLCLKIFSWGFLVYLVFSVKSTNFCMDDQITLILIIWASICFDGRPNVVVF